MTLQELLSYIRQLSDRNALQLIVNNAFERYLEITRSRQDGESRLSAGDSISFPLRNGRRIRGIIEGRGRVNFRILAEDGHVYRVPFHMVEREIKSLEITGIRPMLPVETVIQTTLAESNRLLKTSGIELPVRYKRKVWSTHFRANRHIQFGEKCLAYQLTPGKASDNVGANLRRYYIQNEAASRLAMLVCHEVAHALAHHRYGPYIPHHGRQFYKVLTELVESEFEEIRDKFQQTIAHPKQQGR